MRIILKIAKDVLEQAEIKSNTIAIWKEQQMVEKISNMEKFKDFRLQFDYKATCTLRRRKNRS